jgi:hypothetical protein
VTTRRPARATGHRTTEPQPKFDVAAVTAWVGVALGLMNIYPMVYPWTTAADKILGFTACLVVSALGVRMAHLAGSARLDLVLAVLVVMSVLLIAALLGNP